MNGDELDGLFRVISITVACGDSAGQDAIVIELDQAWDDEHSWAFKLQGLDNNGLGEWSVAWD